METVTIQKAKTQLSRLIKRACQGEEIVIARGSKPVVRLVAIRNQNEDRKPGAWKGKIKDWSRIFRALASGRAGRMGVVAVPAVVHHSILPTHC